MKLACLLAVFVVAVASVMGADDPPPQESVPLYTNADLEKFGPPTSAPGPVGVADEGEWQSVSEFLDREYARIDAERQYELDREEARRLVAAEESPSARYVVPYFGGLWSYPGFRPFCHSRLDRWPWNTLGAAEGKRPFGDHLRTDHRMGSRGLPTGHRTGEPYFRHSRRSAP